jgi:hypothetical protein
LLFLCWWRAWGRRNWGGGEDWGGKATSFINELAPGGDSSSLAGLSWPRLYGNGSAVKSTDKLYTFHSTAVQFVPDYDNLSFHSTGVQFVPDYDNLSFHSTGVQFVPDYDNFSFHSTAVQFVPDYDNLSFHSCIVTVVKQRFETGVEINNGFFWQKVSSDSMLSLHSYIYQLSGYI